MKDSPLESALSDMRWLLMSKYVTDPLQHQIKTIVLEFRFLETFLLRCKVHKCSDNPNLKDLLTSIQNMAQDAGTVFRETEEADQSFGNYASHLLETIQSLKQEVRKAHILITKSLYNIFPLDYGVTVAYIHTFLENLKCLGCYDGDSAAIFKSQIVSLEKEIEFRKDFLRLFTYRCSDNEKLYYLWAHIAEAVDESVCLSFLVWCHTLDDDMAMEYKAGISDIQEQLKPSMPKAQEIYVGVLKASIELQDQPMMGEFLTVFLESILKILNEALSWKVDLVVLMADELDLFHKHLKQVQNFVSYVPEHCLLPDDKIDDFFMKLESIIVHAGFLIYSLYGHTKEDVADEISFSLSGWEEKVKLFEDEITEIYFETGKSSCLSNFCKNDGLRSVESFIERLQDILTVQADTVGPVKIAAETISNDLVFLKPFIQSISMKKDVLEEPNYLWELLLDEACKAEDAIDLILVEDSSIEAHTQLFMQSMEGIRIIKRKITQVYLNGKPDLPTKEVAECFTEEIPEENAPIMDEVPVGFQDETDKLIKHLVDGPANLDVISIVGMAGLGKNTLARKLQSHSTIVSWFDVRPWCQVSPIYEMKELLLDLLGYTIEMNDKIKEKSYQELNALLKKSLMGRRYLIVMDDIWEPLAWDDLRMPFPDDRNGSRIIITTRKAEVADYAKIHSAPHHLRFFTTKESWDMLQKALPKEESSYEELKDVGMVIAENCQGLPLLVALVAGVLRNKEKTREWWEEVAKSTGSHIVGEQKKYLDKIDFSYQNLPDQLKPCFLYLSAFSKSKEIPVRQLMRLWAAEGFVRKSELENAEKMAESYLHQLISRNLVLISKRRAKGGAKACHVHALVHEFCLAKSKEDHFLCVIDGEDEARPQSLKTWFRRLCISSKRDDFEELCPSYKHLHSLLFSAINIRTFYPSWIYESEFPSSVAGYKLLRVLDLGSIRIGDSFAEIELLIHLRFLALLADLTCVPTSITKLRYLETFILKGLKGAIQLPHTIWSMLKLTHLHIYPGVLNIKQESLDDYPKLENFQTFSMPSLSPGGNMEKLITMLPNLQKLKCIVLSASMAGRKGGMFPRLDVLNRLESLKMICQSHHVRPPCVFNFPSKLKKLTLSKFFLPWSEISAVAALTELEILKLNFKAFKGEHWDVKDTDFPSLKFLLLDDVELVRWTSSDEAFPSLKQLVIRKCKQLEEIPCAFQCPNSLQTIDVQWSSHKAAELALEIPEILLNEYGESGPKVSILPADWNSHSSP